MTTDDDFQAALDANPDDWQARLVFADWLQERGDSAAEGYRAMGVQRLCTKCVRDSRWYNAAQYGEEASGENLPSDWYTALATYLGASEEERRRLGCWQLWDFWCTFSTRREAEDAAALAFANLPAARRAELLAHPPSGAPVEPQGRHRE